MFKTEKALVKKIINNSSVNSFFPDSTPTTVFEEVKIGYGVPDVVIVKHKRKNNVNRTSYLNYFDLSILKIIETSKSMTIPELMELTRSSKKQTTATIAKLIDNNLVLEKNHSYSYKNYDNLILDTIAIEAKLTDWKRALNQAYRYKWFSHKSFVCMPESNVKPAQNNIDLFINLGVGLVSVNKENGLNIIFDPEASNPLCSKMEKLLNEYLLFWISKKKTK